jgi:hypothetical protein
MNLLFIHGRSQDGKSSDALRTEWLDALKMGLAKTDLAKTGFALPADSDIHVPFYGDALDAFARASELPLTTDANAKGGEDKKFDAFRAMALESLRENAAIGKDRVRDTLDDGPQEKNFQNWRWVRAVARLVDGRFTPSSKFTIEKFLRDVFLYVSRAGVRDAIDAIVEEKLGPGPTVIVSHSLGTVVAYGVLNRRKGATSVPLLITLGSPLGIFAVRDEFRPIGFPEGIGKWHNAFDAQDIVALRPLDGTNFPVSPAIHNQGTVKNWTENHHGIAGYLDDEEVVRLIAGAFGAIDLPPGNPHL